MLIGLPRVTGAEVRLVRKLDDYSGSIRCQPDLLGLLVQKVNGFDT